jgi:hypothetical protein
VKRFFGWNHYTSWGLCVFLISIFRNGGHLGWQAWLSDTFLKVEISSNGQNCSILSQNVPKFELYEHNDELFNMYYRIFYELLSAERKISQKNPEYMLNYFLPCSCS